MVDRSSFWTTKEAAQYIRVDPDTLRAYCRGKSNGERAALGINGSKPPFAIFGNRTLRFPIEPFKRWAARKIKNLEKD
jgi:hypothetical protein